MDSNSKAEENSHFIFNYGDKLFKIEVDKNNVTKNLYNKSDPGRVNSFLHKLSLLLIAVGVALFVIDWVLDNVDGLKAMKKGFVGKYAEASALRLGLTKNNIIRTFGKWIILILGVVLFMYTLPEEWSKTENSEFQQLMKNDEFITIVTQQYVKHTSSKP